MEQSFGGFKGPLQGEERGERSGRAAAIRNGR